MAGVAARARLASIDEVEKKLRIELEAAAEQYCRAQNYNRALELQDGHRPDSTITKAASMREIQARERYEKRLKAFADFVLLHRFPEDIDVQVQ